MKRRNNWMLGIVALALLPGIAMAGSGHVKKLDFTPGKDLSLLVINYEGTGTFRAFMSEERGQAVVEAENFIIPAALTRTIDTASSTGPVVQITPYNSNENGKSVSKVVLQLRPGAKIKATEGRGRFVLEVSGAGATKAKSNSAKSGRPLGGGKRTSWLETDALKGRFSAPSKGDEVGRKLIEVLNAPPSEKRYFGSKVTFESSKAKVHDIFRLVGETSGLNIVTDGPIADLKDMDYSLKDIPWDQLLDIVIQQYNLKAMISGNVIRIITMEKWNKDQEEKLKAVRTGDDLEPVIMAVIPLSFAKAEEMKTMVSELLIKKEGNAESGQAPPPPPPTVGPDGKEIAEAKPFRQDFIRGKIQVDQRSNSLIVTNTKEAIERIRRLVKELDVPLPQVLIDAKVIIASESFAKSAGINWSGKVTSTGSGRAGLGGGFNGGEATLGAAESTGGSATFTIPSPSVASSSAGLGLGFQVGAGRHGNLNAALALAETSGVSKTVASPRLIVNNKQAATVTDSQTVYVQTAAGANGTGSLQPVQAALSMSVTPQVTSSGSILMDVSIDKGSLEQTGSSPQTSSKSLKTQVLVDSGTTLVLGGVYQFAAGKSESGIPLLKDLPFLGQLFRVNNENTKKDELMVFITPQIVAPSEAAEGASEAM